MILLLDHDDSFVHMLASLVALAGGAPLVRRANALTLDDVRTLDPERIILSPGPCTPNECPLAHEVILALGATVPILGVCLGHQCIAAAFGAEVARAARPLHGMTSRISHDGLDVFRGIPSPFNATRYHSLTVSRENFPESLLITASSDDGEIMGLRHREWPIEGVQFHPESVLTEHGQVMIENFVGGKSVPPP